MSAENCICGEPAPINANNAGCTLVMAPMAFPIFRYRFKEDGTRNSIDVSSATLGADIVALVETSTEIVERLFPTLPVQNPTVPRTDTEYETTASGEKFKLFGQGGIYTFMQEFYGSSGVFTILREFEKMGCRDIDMYIVDVKDQFWGTKPSNTGTDLFAYRLSKQTIDKFFSFPVPGATAKTMLSFDLDKFECVSNSYAITGDQMVDAGGVLPTELLPLTSGFQTLTSPSNTTLETIVFMNGGNAVTNPPVVGLLVAAFTVTDLGAPPGALPGTPIVPTGSVESPDGTYLITVPAMTATNIIQVEVSATGADVATATTPAS